MSNRIDATNCTHEVALARVAELESKLDASVGIVKAQDERIGRLESHNVALVEERDKWQSRVASIEDRAVAIAKERDGLALRLHSAELEGKLDAAAKVCAERHSDTSILSATEAEVRELQSKLDAALVDFKDACTTIEQLRSRLQGVSQELADSEHTRRQLAERLEADQSRLDAALEIAQCVQRMTDMDEMTEAIDKQIDLLQGGVVERLESK